jgi:hypothetical protein
MRPSRRSDQTIEEPVGLSQEIEIHPGTPLAPGVSLGIGTLSWSLPRLGHDLLTADQFLTTLGQVHEKAPGPWVLLLASGRTLTDEPRPEEILTRTGGTAVLFEVINSGRSTARWVLAHGGTQARTHRLRSEQILVRSGDQPVIYDRVVTQAN